MKPTCGEDPPRGSRTPRAPVDPLEAAWIRAQPRVMRSPFHWIQAVALGLVAPWVARADPSDAIVAATPAPDALAALPRLRIAPGLKVSLWAGEPLVRDVTSVSFDSQGHAYVVESGRRRTSVFDVRGLGPWLEDDFAFRTTGDRAEFLRRVLDPADPRYSAFLAAVTKAGKGGFQDFNADGRIDWKDLEVESERIRFVTDEDGDGTADHARTFADGFRSSISGVAAGVLAEGTNVWFTCIPDLWRFPAGDFRFATGTNVVSTAEATLKDTHRILTGFGVHIAFGGHDLHGLIKGPDGRIYFSIADRGSSVTNREGRVVSLPDSGGVFRCEPDGSDFQIVARGLRNPQELAFDCWGNLWTGDNNGDGGDKARWTLVLEGADYGWTIGWQWLPKMGAWNSERLWHTAPSNSAAYIVPPVAHVGHGPAGIAYYPGTGLGDRFRDHFFYADFPGGIRTFRVEPVGAFFQVVGGGAWMEDNASANLTGKLLWDLSPVDVTFPPFGGVMVADWVQGWDKTGKGRLWHVTDPRLAGDPSIAEVRRLLSEGMGRRPDRELLSLLGHPDQRVRLEAQWEFAGRGPGGFQRLRRLALGKGPAIPRIHALWAVEQMIRRDRAGMLREKVSGLKALLRDPDPEVRAQAVPMLLSAPEKAVQAAAWALLSDSSPRVRFATAMAVARLRDPRTLAVKDPSGTLFRLLESESGGDPALRHAGVMALSALGRQGALHWSGPSDAPSVTTRLAEVLVLRALLDGRVPTPESARPELAGRLVERLQDAAPEIVLEAARAIHDLPVLEAFPALAARMGPGTALDLGPDSPWPARLGYTRAEWLVWTSRRALNARVRLGGESNAVALAAFASRPDAPETVRAEALEALGEWGSPPTRDRIVGLYRPIPSREELPARRALEGALKALTRPGTPPGVLVAALKAGERLAPAGFEAVLSGAATHSDPAVRKEASRIRDSVRSETFEVLTSRLESGSIRDRQGAFSRLAQSSHPAVPKVLGDWLDQLIAGRVEADLQADVLDAARRVSSSASLTNQLARWIQSLPAGDPLAASRPALHGGDAANGRRLFAEKADWGCQRCHKLHGEGGDVGPELNGIGRLRGRESVLRSILNPNAEIAPGFESVVVETVGGTTVAGILKQESPTALGIQTPEEGLIQVSKSGIRTRERGPSAMPDGLGELMTLRELRDLVEALSE